MLTPRRVQQRWTRVVIVLAGLLCLAQSAAASEVYRGTGDEHYPVEAGSLIPRSASPGPPLSAVSRAPRAPIIVDSTGDGANLETQTLTMTATGGTYYLSLAGSTTIWLYYDADPAYLQVVLSNTLSSVVNAGGAVYVSQAGNVYTFRFAGGLAGLNVPEMTVDTRGLYGGTATIQTLQDGSFTNPALTLREAIAIAETGDTVQFSPLFNTPQAITLQQGELAISKDLTIQGPGANRLTIDANQAHRVLVIPRGDTSVMEDGVPITVTLSGLTLTHGDSSKSPHDDQQGGGILSLNSGTLNIVEVALVDNTATNNGEGGALSLHGRPTTLNLVRSTLSGNSAYRGGGINIRTDGVFNLVNSTLVNNTAEARGGAIALDSSTATSVNLLNSTLAGNRVTAGRAGGLYVHWPGQIINTLNTIIAGNIATSNPDVYSFGTFVSHGYNLFGSLTQAGGGQIITLPTDQVGVDPKLRLDATGQPKLADNGGTTPTVKLLPISPALDKGGAATFNEAQQVALTFGSPLRSGSFTLTFNGQSTASLAYNATAAQVQAALNALPTIGGVGGSVTVAGSNYTYLVAFGGALRGADLPLMTATSEGNTNAAVVPIKDGSAVTLTTDQRGFPRPVDQPLFPPAAGGNNSDIGAVELALIPPAKPAAWRAGTWFLRTTLTSGPADLVFLYGLATDTPLMCDWDGNGSRTAGVFRAGAWFLRNSNTGGVSDITLRYGLASDKPICGDWDGDGIDTVGVIRGNAWYLRNSNTSGIADSVFLYGMLGDRWVGGDWDGDETSNPGAFRDQTWYLRQSNSSGVADQVFMYGLSLGDTPTVGDWNGDGVSTVGIWRGNLWYLRNSNTAGNADVVFQYGTPGDTLLVWR